MNNPLVIRSKLKEIKVLLNRNDTRKIPQMLTRIPFFDTTLIKLYVEDGNVLMAQELIHKNIDLLHTHILGTLLFQYRIANGKDCGDIDTLPIDIKNHISNMLLQKPKTAKALAF